MNRVDKLKVEYRNLLHAMQTGVAFKLESDDKETAPKHLRVGLNSSMCMISAQSRLLMLKGVFTEEEYYDTLVAVLKEEVLSYERWLSDRVGSPVRLT